MATSYFYASIITYMIENGYNTINLSIVRDIENEMNERLKELDRCVHNVEYSNISEFAKAGICSNYLTVYDDILVIDAHSYNTFSDASTVIEQRPEIFKPDSESVQQTLIEYDKLYKEHQIKGHFFKRLIITYINGGKSEITEPILWSVLDKYIMNYIGDGKENGNRRIRKMPS